MSSGTKYVIQADVRFGLLGKIDIDAMEMT